MRETKHPYTFVSIEGFKDLLTAPDAATKASPLLTKMAPSLRAALSSRDPGAFERGLTALAHLSDCVGTNLDHVLKVRALYNCQFVSFICICMYIQF